MINRLAPFCWAPSLLLGSLPFAGFRRFLEGGNESEQGRPLLAAENKILPETFPEEGPSRFVRGTQDLGGRPGSPSSPCAPEQVQAFDKKLEDMSSQVLQWQKQHQSDLKMLAAKEEQLRAFQEEMCALKENLLADEKEVGAPRLPITSSPKNIHSPPPRTSQDHTWDDRLPWVGLGAGCLGARKGHLPHSVPKQGLGVQGPQLLSQPDHLPVTLLIEILSRAKVPIQRGESAISLSGTPAAP